MAVSLKHSYVSAQPDSGNPDEVSSGEWNAEHTLTLADARILGRAAGTAGAVQELTVGTGLTLSGTALSLAAVLEDIAALSAPTVADQFIVSTAAGVFALESGATVRTSLGLGSLATQSTISNADWSGTDLSVANGGTGASTFTDGGILYGNAASAFSVTAAPVGADEFLVSTGAGTWGLESATNARSSLGLGSLATQSTINNADWSGTDLSVANGGTGVSTFTSGGILLGNGASAVQVTAAPAGADEFLVSTGIGTWGLESAASARTSLGLGSLATQSTISNADWSGTDLAVLNGGTGASDAGTARTNLGAQAQADILDDIAAVPAPTVADEFLVSTAAGAFALESGTTVRASLGLGSLATLSSVNNSNWSGTDLSVANGGTGASTLTDGGILYGNGTSAISVTTAPSAADQFLVSTAANTWGIETATNARTSLGLAIGTDVQAQAAILDDIGAVAAPTVADEFLVSTAAGVFALESGATVRTSLGLGSLATASTIDNADWSGTDLSVANGGTGASTFTDGGILYGNGTAAFSVTAAPAGADEFLVSTGAGTWGLESATSARTSLGLGSLATQSTISNADWSGTDLSVANGGTGASTFTDGGILYGNGASAFSVTAAPAGADEFLVSTGIGTWGLESGATARASLGLTIGTDVQAQAAILDDIGAVAAPTVADQFIVSTAAGVFALESGATVRTSLGLGSLATLSTVNNGNWSGTDLTVANGGTGASTFTDGGILYGNGTAAFSVTTAPAGADEFLVSTGAGTWGLESATSARTSLGLGSLATLSTVNDGNWSGTDLAIANGGTGASTASAAFDALKQAATETTTGVVELATTAEAEAGTDTSRAVTPAGVAAAITAQSGGITLATPQSTTTGTAIDFTSIPAGTKRITVMFDGVSTSSTSDMIVQLGDSGGIEATGYNGSSVDSTQASGVAHSTGFILNNLQGATDLIVGAMTLTLMDATNRKWVMTSIVADDAATNVAYGAGFKSLSAELDRVRITTTNGTDTFDAGAINISYES